VAIFFFFFPIVEFVNCEGQHTDKSRDKGRTINYPGFSITQVPINQVPLYMSWDRA
jgi:hypothetical protein